MVTATTFNLFKANIQRWRPLALNRVNVVAVTTILVLHVGVIGHPVPCHYDFMFPRRSYHARLGRHSPSPGQKGGLWAARPPIVPSEFF